ncbi:zinc-binding dehydrogenase [Catellatospora sp. NPDC049111]|uniref:zinc-binding dehydrogenase n=1 Tax=Catellatospora sp. NPDC049111 TaxID=3155271 RepID=UPI00340676A7
MIRTVRNGRRRFGVGAIGAAGTGTAGGVVTQPPSPAGTHADDPETPTFRDISGDSLTGLQRHLQARDRRHRRSARRHCALPAGTTQTFADFFAAAAPRRGRCGTGGLGAILVQLARAAGATVIAAARGTAKLERIGADVAVDYSQPGWTEQVGPVDVVLDGAGGEFGRAAFILLGPGGRYSGHGSSAGSFAAVDRGRGRAARGDGDRHRGRTAHAR